MSYDLGRAQVAGKIVLFNVKYDRQMAAQDTAAMLTGKSRAIAAGRERRRKAGSCGFSSFVPSVARRIVWHTRRDAYAQDAPRIPSGAVSSEDADLIAGLSKK